MTDLAPDHPTAGAAADADTSTPDDALVDAVEIALDLLEAETARDLSAADLAAGRELAALGVVGAVAAGGGELPQPRPWVRARLLERIREERFQFVRGAEGAWVPLPTTPGGHAKTLYLGARPGARTRLLRVPAAASIAELDATHDPALVVVEGALWRGDTAFDAGAVLQPSPEDAGAWRSPAGCAVLVVERAEAGPARRRVPRVHADAPSGWRPLAPGTDVLPVAGGRDEETDVMLLRMAPGGVLPDHEHGGLEEIFLLRGSCVCEGTRLRAGDYHRAAGGSEHHETTTDEGCVMVVVLRKAA